MTRMPASPTIWGNDRKDVAMARKRTPRAVRRRRGSRRRHVDAGDRDGAPDRRAPAGAPEGRAGSVSNHMPERAPRGQKRSVPGRREDAQRRDPKPDQEPGRARREAPEDRCGTQSAKRFPSDREWRSSSAIPAASSSPSTDVLGDYPELRHILVRHEQGGAHAAEGYARATGKVGVCLGNVRARPHEPGQPASATPLLDSVPIVAITGNVRRFAAGQRMPSRRFDITGINPGLHQAQLPGPRRQRHPACLRRGLPHRQNRQAGPGFIST